jgi:hypothetical protein
MMNVDFLSYLFLVKGISELYIRFPEWSWKLQPVAYTWEVCELGFFMCPLCIIIYIIGTVKH